MEPHLELWTIMTETWYANPRLFLPSYWLFRELSPLLLGKKG